MSIMMTCEIAAALEEDDEEDDAEELERVANENDDDSRLAPVVEALCVVLCESDRVWVEVWVAIVVVVTDRAPPVVTP